MAMLKCKMCGGNLIPDATGRLSTCEYCGTVQTVPTGEDTQKLNLFNRANRLRLDCEFDKAAALYEKLVTEFPEDAEGYWGLCLSKYGIEYVDDPATGKKVPTCHRASFEAITADPDYRAALDRADAAARAVYMEQGYAIDTLQHGIMEIVRTEKPFDVFLCYKETDAAGRRTPDSVIANDIYYQLTNEGFKVFYSAITLENKLGQAYEPYIFAALHSAKVMLVIGTAPEYFNAVWVRNEWSRFLKLMKTDRTKLLIPCYKDMDAYELPEEFSHLQAQDMGKIGFITDVIRGIKKVLQKDAPKGTPAGNIPNLLRRVALFLEDEDWENADEYCERILDLSPENAQAYYYKLLARLHVRNPAALWELQEPFDMDPNYGKALRFGDEKLCRELIQASELVRSRWDNDRFRDAYDYAVNLMQNATLVVDFEQAAKCFSELSGYRDADRLKAKCEGKIKELLPSELYQDGLLLMQEGKYKTAIRVFQKIRGYQDADLLLQRANELAERGESDHKYKRERLRILIILAVAIALMLLLFFIINDVVLGVEDVNSESISFLYTGAIRQNIAVRLGICLF